MSSTEDKEKQMIRDWAKRYHGNYKDSFFNSFGNGESLWLKYGDCDDIKEYEFHTVPELKKVLSEYLADDSLKEVTIPICVAAFKKKNINKNVPKSSQSKDFSIPEFIYVF